MAFFGNLVRRVKPATKVRRPGAGPRLVPFSQAEVNALARYTTGYPLEEASSDERDAFYSGLDKIKARAKEE